MRLVPWAITCGGGYEERVGVVEVKFEVLTLKMRDP